MHIAFVLLLIVSLSEVPFTGAAVVSSIHRRANATDESKLIQLVASNPQNLDDNGSDSTMNTTAIQQAVSSANASIDPGRQLLGSTANDDETKSGNYVIYQCGSGKPDSHAEELHDLLPKVWADLQNVRYEIAFNGLNSQYGAQPLFKTKSNLNKARAIYQSMAAGSAVVPTPGKPAIPPTIVCGDPEFYTPAAERCAELSSGNTKQIAFSPFGSNIVVLCPDFWSLQYEAPPHSRCPVAEPTMEQMQNGLLLPFSRRSVLVHELAHIYLGTSVGNNAPYGVNGALALSAADAIKSPATFALLYAGKSA